jgi:serine phosphatase RsbU (regulator of sigma subunit)
VQRNSLSYLFVFLTFLSLTNLFSQQEKFDSLKKLISNTTAPKEKTELYLQIAKSIYNTIPDSSMPYCEASEKISKQYNLEVQLAFSLHCECRYLLLKGDIKTTIVKLNQAISIFEKNKEYSGLSKAYSLKSIALARLNKYDERLEYLLKAKEIHSKVDDKEGYSSVLLNLSNAYHDYAKYEEALNTLKEFENLNLPENGRSFYKHNHYGNIYLALKNYQEAIFHFKKCIQFAHDYKMLDSEITGLINLAETYIAQKDFNTAQNYYQLALSLAVENRLIVEEADALKGIIHIYELQKNYIQAYFSLKRYKTIEDSLLNIEKLKSINDIENKLKLSEKEKIIAQQSLSLEKEKVALASSKNNTLLLIGGLAITLIVIGFLFYFNKRTNKLYDLIKIQKIEVEAQKEIIELKNKDVMDSIHYAKYIQGSMLPSSKIVSSLFVDHFILYKPKDIVAGDFYWTETLNQKSLLAVCDCTGHGVPGAMVSIVACNALNRAVKEFKLEKPDEIFNKVNELMQETFSKSDYDVSDGMDGVLCSFDRESLILTVAAANNPVWIFSEHKGLQIIYPDKHPIGKFQGELKPFKLSSYQLQEGDMVYLFSDGYADQFGGPIGKKFKYKQLQELLSTIYQKPTYIQKELLNASVENWKGQLNQVDDILLVGFRA